MFTLFGMRCFVIRHPRVELLNPLTIHPPYGNGGFDRFTSLSLSLTAENFANFFGILKGYAKEIGRLQRTCNSSLFITQASGHQGRVPRRRRRNVGSRGNGEVREVQKRAIVSKRNVESRGNGGAREVQDRGSFEMEEKSKTVERCRERKRQTGRFH